MSDTVQSVYIGKFHAMFKTIVSDKCFSQLGCLRLQVIIFRKKLKLI